MNLKLRNECEKIRQEFNQKKKPMDKSVQYGKPFFYICPAGMISADIWINSKHQNAMMDNHNVFLSQEEAKEEHKKRLLWIQKRKTNA